MEQHSSDGFEMMRPLKPIYVAIFVAQVVGCAAGLWYARYPSWFENLWSGACVLTLPGYVAGVALQRKLAPAALHEHLSTVKRMGLVALMLLAAVFLTPHAAG